jgi:hypothetical protein
MSAASERCRPPLVAGSPPSLICLPEGHAATRQCVVTSQSRGSVMSWEAEA